jgi:hypothetical protein
VKPLRSPKDVGNQPLRPSWWPFCKGKDLARKLNQIMATQTELVAQLATIKTTLDKVAAESAATLAEVTRLTDLVAGMGDAASAELIAAVQAVADQVKVVDDLVPDAPAP